MKLPQTTNTTNHICSDETRPPPSTPRVRRKASDSGSSGFDRGRPAAAQQEQQPPPTPRSQRRHARGASNSNQRGDGGHTDHSSSTSGAGSQMTKPSSLITTGMQANP